MIDLNKALDNARKWAKAAGDFQIEMLNKNISCSSKSTETDLVTEVDMKCEEILIKYIKENYPEHNIITEETGLIGENSDFTWILDPLDGTVNYYYNYPIFAVSIGLHYKGNPIIGVVFVPRLDEEYYAVKDKGAFLNNNKIQVSNKTQLKELLVGTGFPYDKGIDINNNNTAIFKNILPNIMGIRRSGSAAFDLCQIACGRLSGFWELKLKLWDFAAAELIIKEAGGYIYINKQEKGYNIVAGNKIAVSNLKLKIDEVYEGF